NFTQAMALWELIKRAAPTDEEAQHKAKDLAASATIARGKYEEVIHAKNAPESETEEAAAIDRTEPSVSPVEERCARESAPLLARVQADPGNAGGYLHLAAVYRRADQLDKAREVLQQGLEKTANNFEIALELADLD